ncbi:MAG: hypothetical protein MPF33_05835 [Candidatus Aramenus sp.]|nr:hypothetical protein [Candidatus Aramenus sp.]
MSTLWLFPFSSHHGVSPLKGSNALDLVNELNAKEEVLRERKRLFSKIHLGFIIYRTLASHLAKSLWDLGVSTVYLGYPYFISRMVTSSLQIWSFRKMALQ